ncbi:MAG TPA: MFS transporter [Candidatus Polarisedimenticolia bacterium]|nr:MFS transporter [Candidatus Polarisedimenticolia bacterium]
MQDEAAGSDTMRGAGPEIGTSSAKYALVILTTIYSLNFLDRTVINILIDPIKHEYHLSDTVMGFISGFGFVMMYSILAAPVARWADRGNRRSIITWGLVLWSGMTALGGVARNALQLTLSRFGVGIGEAAGTAPSTSMISDLFPGEKRLTAMSIYQLGPVIGGFLGSFIGGWVNQYYGWHDAFLVAGVPGLLVALVFRFTVKEPTRGISEKQKVDTSQQGLRETIRFMSGQKCYVFLLAGFCFTTFTQFGFGTWTAVFLGRIQHLNTAQIGTYAGTLRGIAGLAGTLAGGYLSDWAGRKNVRWRIYVSAIASMLTAPAVLVFLFAPSLSVCLIGFTAAMMFSPVHVGPLVGVSHSVVKVGMRAFATSVIYLIAELVGLGLGPLFIGAFNDHFANSLGVGVIRYSMATAAVTTFLGGLLFVVAARYMERDMARTVAD